MTSTPSLYLAALTRAPTMIQKDYMRRDLFAFRRLLAWTRLVVNKQIILLDISIDSFHKKSNLLDAIMESDESHPSMRNYSFEERMIARQLIHDWEQAAVPRDPIKVLEDVPDSILSVIKTDCCPVIFGAPVLFSTTRRMDEWIVRYDTGESQGERKIDLTPISTYELISSGEITDPITILILTLYLLDHDRNVSNQGRQGQAIPRFLSVYPSKEINRVILERWSKYINLVRAYELAHPETDALKQMTRESLRTFAENLAKIQAETKAKNDKFNLEDSEFFNQQEDKFDD